MKKLLMFLLTSAIAVCCVSCGSFDDSAAEESTKLANANINVSAEGASEAEALEEKSSLPDKENFSEIPDEAAFSFDRLIDAVCEVYPCDAEKRLYGYLGTDTICDELCYVFTVYDVSDDDHTEVVNAAVNGDGSIVYVFDKEKSEYEKLVYSKSVNGSEEITETFSEHLSADVETVSDVSEKAE